MSRPENTLAVTALTTGLFHPGDDLAAFVQKSVPQSVIRERMILAVTSKIVSLAEKRLLPKSEVGSKEELVRREADCFLGTIGYDVSLTIAQGLFIPSAGIDESNAEDDFYILYPKDPYASARRLWTALRDAWGLRELGIILTDSHTTPLRRGVTGIGLSFWGFRPTQTLVGAPDLFGRPFKMTHVNRVDALSAAAVLAMGEGLEPKPLAVVYASEIEFSDQDHRTDLMIPAEDDLYHPIYRHLIRQAEPREGR